MHWDTVAITLKLAFMTTLILLPLSLPIAYWLVFSRRKWKFRAEAVVALPLVLPPTVLGFYVLVAIGPWSPLGRFYEAVFGNRLPFTFQGLLFASILYSLPFAVQPLMAAFQSVDRRLIEASWTLGVSKLGTFFRVILPLSVPGLITALVLSFAHTMGEFGVVVMVGGNIQGATRTMSIDIYDRVQALDYASAGQTSLVLLLFSFAVLTLLYSIHNQVWRVWPKP
ncbi:MAG TPA: molybdate ABC transporter permease subunit [Candidatus Binatia bacterium]|nr:molybdate ABC transporter permease subunit [Candidatus Binatia bacterium]